MMEIKLFLRIKNILFLVLVFLFSSQVAFAGNSPLVDDTVKLKILSYNIHRGQDSENQDRLEEMAAFIKDANVDIVGLQEVDSICTRSGQADQTKVLGDRTGMNSVFVRHFPFQGGAYGLALLSKYPIENVQNHRLPVEPGTHGSSTAFLTAEVHISDEVTWLVGVAHLDYRDRESRLDQIKIINEIFEASPLPGILMGDLNAEPGSREINRLLKNFQSSQPDDYYTFAVLNPEKKIDFILFRNTDKIKILDQKVPKVNFSDHLPVITKIQY